MTTAPPDAGALPLTFAQRRLWALDQLSPSMTAYNQVSAYRLRGTLHVAPLRWALDRLVRRHSALRVAFPSTRGEPWQDIRPASTVHLAVTDLTDRPAVRRERQAREILAASLAEPFDLAAGPLIRVHLVRLAEHDHVLAVIYHHIVCDGWSLNILFEDLTALYDARLAGRADPLPPLPVDYADYVRQEQDRLTDPAIAGELSWWRDRLAGASTTLDLPTDRSRGALPNYAGGHHHCLVPALPWADLTRAARQHRTTPFLMGLTGYAALLCRLTGRTEVVIGTPVANRSAPDAARVIGNFANNLPLRVDGSGDPSVATLLRRVRGVALDGFARQDIPFERLVAELRPPRQAGTNPLVQTMFMLHTGHLFAGLSGVSVEVFRIEQQTTPIDLLVEVAPFGERTRLTFRYATALFDPPTVERMAEQYGRVLAACVTDPETPLSQLPVLGEEDRQRILIRWSGVRQACPATPPIHRLIAERAAMDPAAIAVVCADERLSYGELDGRADRLARRLRAMGVGADSVVGLRLPRGIDHVVAVLAVLKAGGALLPLDPALPAARQALLTRTTRATVLIGQTGVAEQAGAPTLLLDQPDAPDPTPVPGPARTEPDQLLYVLFTSGSTGEPKGVAVSHAAAANNLRWMQERYRLTTADRVLHKASTSFDVSIFEILWPLMAGARIVVATDDDRQDPDRLLELIVTNRVTVAHFVPPALAEFLDGTDAARATSLRWLLSGGQALPGGLPARCRSTWPSVRLDNQYGPTETAITAVAGECPANEETGAIVPIGRPTPGAVAYVLDRALQPVPEGIAGELYIGGIAVARGYLERPGLTADRFVPDPFGAPGGRVYRTGDRVRWRPDGTLEFLGRLDDQLKLRGYRIEPAEIEHTLTRHPAVTAAAVTVYRRTTGEEQLVAYAALAPGAARTSDLRTYLSTQLPAYCVPAFVVPMDRLPLDHNGKLDRSALPSPIRPGAPADADGIPRAGLERAIAAVWRELLDIADVGRHDNFFDLGGHSLLVPKLRAAIGDALRRDLPMVTFYEYPTVAALAGLLSADGREAVNGRDDAGALRAGQRRIQHRRQLAVSQDDTHER